MTVRIDTLESTVDTEHVEPPAAPASEPPALPGDELGRALRRMQAIALRTRAMGFDD